MGGRLTARYHAVSKPRPNRFYVDRNLDSNIAEMHVKFLIDMIIMTSNIAASRLHEIWW